MAKFHVINVSKSFGVSTKTGEAKEFDIQSVTILGPFEQVDRSPKYKREGEGLQAVEVGVSPAFFPLLLTEFKKLYKRQPVVMDLETAVGGNSRLTVIGFSSAASGMAG